MIELKNVSFSYVAGNADNDEVVEVTSNGSLKNIDISIKDGEFILLTGGSGCGKTTILRLINGLIPNFYSGKLEGNVLVEGKNISHAELYDTAKLVSTVFQNPRSQFFNVDTTSELAFACENRGMPENEILKRIDETVRDLKLEPLMNRSLFCLSGGQKQKIACASVAVSRNKVILLDEPSANLDLKTIDELQELLAKWKGEGKTIVVAEHRISYLWSLADRTIILDGGQIAKELSRSDMDNFGEDELHALGLRTNKNSVVDSRLLKNKEAETSPATENRENNPISLKTISYKYKNGYQALNIPSMDITPALITAITGNNGEGKTTFLNCICGLLPHSKGTVVYKGKAYKRRARQKLFYLVMQDVNHQLFSESVLDEVLISQPEANEDEARRILATLDLTDFTDRHPMSLSGGQKQRVAVACAIASGREIMLFDEPTSGLDYTHMQQIGKILRQLKSMGKTVIVVTHDRELIKECCDEVIDLKAFNLVKQA